ncbi:hypothetical protein BW727_101214 [Jeotgalibaca dankookensis]|uniref:Uncharacterized protein n=1 Tax=Jeotgalibaca dankookensis TaxID=708126 RepID=A0A1S6IPU5_9LACT|nr:hypothetical protein [Jeotgalibaca dankookensis]AQS53581.1 hypothetical protein BW727_101214 [Jeotgalibaca dankookensis]
MKINWRFGLGIGISLTIYNLIMDKYWPDLHILYRAIFAGLFVGIFSFLIEQFLLLVV